MCDAETGVWIRRSGGDSMLAIRMRRMGSKKKPFFRVVVIDSRAPRDGRSVEVLGHYDPRSESEAMVVDRERLTHWLDRGARPSDTVRSLLARRRTADAQDSLYLMADGSASS